MLPDYERAHARNVATRWPRTRRCRLTDGVVMRTRWCPTALAEQMQDRIGMLRGLSSMNAARITTDR